MPSAVATVADALIANWTALPGLTGVEVVDGPRPEAPGPGDLVVLGHNGDPESTAEVTVTQELASLDGSSRWETGVVPCCVVSQSGDTDLSARRARAFALLAAIETSVRADLTLGGLVLSAQITSAGARQLQNGAGSAVVVPFEITYFAQV